MQVAVITGPGGIDLREEPRPAVGPTEVLVEVGVCGICTMERRLWLGEKRIYPVAPGHEVAGRVVEVGDGVADLEGAPQVGEMVAVDLLTRCGACSACRRGRTALCKRPQGGNLTDGTISMGAGFADYLVAPAGQAWPTRDARVELASMVEPLACVAHSVRLSGFLPGDRVAVIGGGFMGRLHLALTQAAGASSVGVIDVDDARRRDAGGAGASWTADPDAALEVGGRQDVVFATAGAPGVLEAAVELCDDGGTVVLYGAFPKRLTAEVKPDAIHHHELSLVGVYSHEPEDWRTAAGLLRSPSIAAQLERLITARFPLADVREAFHLATSSPVYRVLVG
jgi:L-iditol 2-dehydrogenase